MEKQNDDPICKKAGILFKATGQHSHDNLFETCLTLNQSNQINNAGPAVVVIRSADFYTNVQLIKWSKFEDM